MSLLSKKSGLKISNTLHENLTLIYIYPAPDVTLAIIRIHRDITSVVVVVGVSVVDGVCSSVVGFGFFVVDGVCTSVAVVGLFVVGMGLVVVKSMSLISPFPIDVWQCSKV